MLLTLITALAVTAAPPNWSCLDAYYADGTCDCGCTVQDSDCATAKFQSCQRSGCSGGQVPWEHQNSSCMSSSCGDGWKASNEACDDGNALQSGGCNASCSAVNPGFQCGEFASGCSVAPAVDAGAVDGGSNGGADAGSTDAGISDAGPNDGGAGGEPDAGSPDAGRNDSGSGAGQDAGSVDAGPRGQGADASTPGGDGPGDEAGEGVGCSAGPSGLALAALLMPIALRLNGRRRARQVR